MKLSLKWSMFAAETAGPHANIVPTLKHSRGSVMIWSHHCSWKQVSTSCQPQGFLTCSSVMSWFYLMAFFSKHTINYSCCDLVENQINIYGHLMQSNLIPQTSGQGDKSILYQAAFHTFTWKLELNGDFWTLLCERTSEESISTFVRQKLSFVPSRFNVIQKQNNSLSCPAVLMHHVIVLTSAETFKQLEEEAPLSHI